MKTCSHKLSIPSTVSYSALIVKAGAAMLDSCDAPSALLEENALDPPCRATTFRTLSDHPLDTLGVRKWSKTIRCVSLLIRFPGFKFRSAR